MEADQLLFRGASRASSVSSRSIRSTRSLRSTDLTHVVENGRTYPNDAFYMPCDALEQTRLDILHRLFLAALDGALTTAPIGPAIQRVLDVGTGPGEWACQMADHFPDTEIVAVDLAVWELPLRDADDSDGEPAVNVIWEIDDLEPCPGTAGGRAPSLRSRLAHAAAATDADADGLAIDQGYASGSTGKTPSEPRSLSEALAADDHDRDRDVAGWNFSEPFDFVHIRNMKGAFRDWAAVYREAFVSLAPGGLLEVVDLMVQFPDPDDDDDDNAAAAAATADSALRELLTATFDAAARAGRPVSLAHLDARVLEDAGFTDVKKTVVDVPMGPWPDDERLAVMGKMWLVCCAEGIEAVCLRLLTRTAGWDVGRVKEKVRQAREEILQGRHGAIVTQIWFVTARKGRRKK